MYTPSNKWTTRVPTRADLPTKALPHIPTKLKERLGGSTSQMFPEFATCFPLTVTAMERCWSKPNLAVTESRDWLAWVFLEREDRNLFFGGRVLWPRYDEHPEWIEDGFGHLPKRWFGLYHSMSSFVITQESSYSPIGWRNTPLPNGMGIDTFSTETHTKKTKLKAFAKQIGAANELSLSCYLLTDAHDSLWVVDKPGGPHTRKVHHVKADRFEEAYVLPDPENTLDEYMAHVVAGGEPKDFDFRKPSP
jgi:hypothetical protein